LLNLHQRAFIYGAVAIEKEAVGLFAFVGIICVPMHVNILFFN